jgi:hypothetical protein
MRVVRLVLAASAAIAVAHAAAAQTAERVLTPLEVAVACGPPTTLEMPQDPLRITGAQDTVNRIIFNAADLLVINGGTRKGVQLGQQYFVRRPILSGVDRMHPKGVQTLGWLTIVAANDDTAIAKLDHFCEGVYAADYLEPFTPPSIPAEFEKDEPLGELDFGTLNRIVAGVANMTSGAQGSLMLIDRGSDQNTAAGLRFAVYRDLRTTGLPLASVGEGIVLTVGKTMSLARITRSRDAIISGDYVVPRK